jgi:hypothetical protein
MMQDMMSGFLIQLVFVAVLILAAVMVVIRMGRLGGNAASAARSMADPVPGTLLVTAATLPSQRAIYAAGRVTGVISADGVEAFAVQHRGLMKTSRWPRPGQQLPVIVDRADPRNFAVAWDKVQNTADAALGSAEALAAAMRARQDDPPP